MQHDNREALIHNLNHADRSVRIDAIFALGEQRARDAVPALIEILEDAGASGRELDLYAAVALGKIGDPRALPALLVAHERGLFAALDGLAGIPAEEAFTALLRAFEQSHHPHVATLLGRRGDRRAVPALIAAMDDPDKLVRFYTVRALGRLGDPRAIEALLAASDDQRVVKKSIARAVQTALTQIQEQMTPDTEGTER